MCQTLCQLPDLSHSQVIGDGIKRRWDGYAKLHTNLCCPQTLLFVGLRGTLLDGQKKGWSPASSGVIGSFATVLVGW